MKRYSILIILLILANFSCSSDDSVLIESFWVDSERVSCVGLEERTCYRVQEGITINESNWQLFYNSIEGFDEIYEEGYRYQLKVKKIKIENPPQDGSSLNYKLIEIVNKELNE